MWIVKSIFFGGSLFAIGVVLFLFALFRSKGPIIAGPGQHWMMDISVISHLTVLNPWFYAALAGFIVIGFAVVVSWPGKFSPGPSFWVLLLVIDLVPVGGLLYYLILAAKLREVSGLK